MNDRFVLGVTYWPQSKGVGWWGQYDRGEVREELAHAAALGIGLLRLNLLWEDFQPRFDRIGLPAMQAFEQTIEIADELGLRVVATLFAGAASGALHYPSWLTTSSAAVDVARMLRRGRTAARPPARPQPAELGRELVFEQGYRATTLRDIYDDPLLVEAQRYLVREVIGYFGSHPALWAWELGHQTELARQPRSPEAFAEWQRRLVDAAREAGANQVICAVSLRALARRHGPRPDYLAEVGDALLATADAPPALRFPELPAAEEALLAFGLVRKLAPGAAVLVDNLGLSTVFEGYAGWVDDRIYGQPQRSFLADEERQGYVVGDRLRQLYEAGAQGVILTALGDYRSQLWRRPPLDRALRERTPGLLRADGSEKPAALAVKAFGEQLQADSLGQGGSRPLDLAFDPEEYERHPGRVMQHLLKELVQGESEVR